MKKYHNQKIMTVGSATLDLFFQSDKLPESETGQRLSLAYGGKYVADQFVISLGGGGTNAAVSLARQGFKVFCWARIAQDWPGKQILANLKSENVKTNLLEINSEQTTTSAILLGRGGERTIITYRGKNDYLTLSRKVEKTMAKCTWLYFADLARATKKLKLTWLKIAKNKGLKIVLALSGNEYKQGLNYLDEYFSLADIFILNAHELADIWGGNAPDLDLNKINYAAKLKLPLLIVTYDIKGSWAYTNGQMYHQPIVKPKQIADTTGAGDAFASGFLGAYIKSGDIQKSLKFAARNAASVISYISTQKGLLHDDEKD